jgi:hypothetical protein
VNLESIFAFQQFLQSGILLGCIGTPCEKPHRLRKFSAHRWLQMIPLGGIVSPSQKSIDAGITLLTLLALSFLSVSCSSRPSCESVEATTIAILAATGTPSPMQVAQVDERWGQGSHAETYVEGQGEENSRCARCHAPGIWKPLQIELPVLWEENGLEGSAESSSIPFEAWTHVGCEVCHPGLKEDITGEIAFLAIAPLGVYQQVDTSTHLCLECHGILQDEEHFSFDFVGVHAELGCIDCHDEHDGSATCGDPRCHQPFAGECIQIETHDKPHSEVTCGGCHDGSGLAIGWNPDLEQWDTFDGGDPRFEPDSDPIVSHNIVLEVDCDRCHAPGDHPWDPQ